MPFMTEQDGDVKISDGCELRAAPTIFKIQSPDEQICMILGRECESKAKRFETLGSIVCDKLGSGGG